MLRQSGRRVVITGVGTVNPLANNLPDTWNRIVKGECGIDKIRSFDATSYTCQVAGEVENFNFEDYFGRDHLSKVKRLDPFVHYAQAAFLEAKQQAGLEVERFSERIGVAVGSGIGGMHVNRKQSGVFHTKGHRRCSPFYIPSLIGNMASGFLSIENGIKGPNVSLQTACATGNHSIAMGYFIIREGMADVMVSGATEGIVEPLTISGFANMRALSTSYNDEPKVASRPFDKGRDGFVIAEGSAIFILEEYEFAKKRNAPILCELMNVGMSGDAYDMVIPSSDGAYRSMKQALEMAGLSIGQVDYINCHGTSTPLGDISETQAVERLLSNEEALKLHIGSTKSMTGHLIGAASALEAAISVMSIQHNLIPANINLFEIDDEIKIGHLINTEPIEKEVRCVLSNSFGFGGHNSTAVFKRI